MVCYIITVAVFTSHSPTDQAAYKAAELTRTTQHSKCQWTHKQRGWSRPLPFNIVPAFLQDTQQTNGLLLSHLESPWQHLYTIRSTNTNTHSWCERKKDTLRAFPVISMCMCHGLNAHYKHSIHYTVSADQSELIRQQRAEPGLESPSPSPDSLHSS